MWRWLKFNAVGIGGFALQLAVLTFLVGVAGLHYMAATFLAVGAAILHNFAWHERWTWVDRAKRGRAPARLIRFTAANGMISMAGNLILMWLLVERLRLPYPAANVLAVAACSLLNFFAGDRVVFRDCREC
jgi:putative flippase GtrA